MCVNSICLTILQCGALLGNISAVRGSQGNCLRELDLFVRKNSSEPSLQSESKDQNGYVLFIENVVQVSFA